jgi:lipopolysaccharide export system protein LptA
VVNHFLLVLAVGMGRSAKWFRLLYPMLGTVVLTAGGLAAWPVGLRSPQAVAQDGGTITLRSDVQEANANTGVITARGNVQIDYPSRQISATSAQAEYYSNERRIVLSGNVVIHQEGNTLRAETATYLIDEGEFVALPAPDEQVEATYTVPASQPASVQDAPGTSPAPARPPVLLDVTPIEDADGVPASNVPLGN